MKYLISIIVLLLVMTPARADVVAVSDDEFFLRIEAMVPVSSEEAYEHFLEVGQWWVSSHTYFGDSENLDIQAYAGGCFCEREDDKSVLHMLVSYVNPGHEIRMLGGLGPLQGLALHGAMKFSFEDVERGSRIVHEYRVTGSVSHDLKNLAAVVNSVQTQQVNALRQYIEKQPAW